MDQTQRTEHISQKHFISYTAIIFINPLMAIPIGKITFQCYFLVTLVLNVPCKFSDGPREPLCIFVKKIPQTFL